MNLIPFEIKALIGGMLIELFYKKMGKRLKAKSNQYHGAIDTEWSFIGSHKRETILFLHGFSDRKENFYFASNILSKNYDIIIPDMPGFGNSTIDNNLEYSLENYEDWIGEFIESINISDFHLVGNSLGGAVCAKLAVRYPERIKSLSLVDPAGFYIPEKKSVYDEALKGINLFQVETLEDYEVFRDRVFHRKPKLPNFVKEYMIKSAIKKRDWYGKIFNELLPINLVRDRIKTIEEVSLNSICKDIKVPTKIFWGKHDTLFPYQTIDILNREIIGSQTYIFENLGHCPHLEDPKSFAKELDDFLKSVK